MPDFLYKRTKHLAEYYRITAPNAQEGEQKLEANLDTLASGLEMLHDGLFPAEKVLGLVDNELIELVETLPQDDHEGPTSPLPDENTTVRSLPDKGSSAADELITPSLNEEGH